MADLKKELDTYLSRNDKSQTQPLINDSVKFSRPDIKSWFSKSSSTEATTNATGWFADAQKDCCPAMTKMQRMMGFCFCILMGFICFILAAMYVPFLLLKARKFALLYTIGCLFFICSFAFLWGPMNHLLHLFSRDRFPFTITYFGSMAGTLYFSMCMISTPLTVLFAVFQVITILWFVASYIPGGQTGMKFFSRLFSSAVTNTVSKTLPV